MEKLFERLKKRLVDREFSEKDIRGTFKSARGEEIRSLSS